MGHPNDEQFDPRRDMRRNFSGNMPFGCHPDMRNLSELELNKVRRDKTNQSKDKPDEK